MYAYTHAHIIYAFHQKYAIFISWRMGECRAEVKELQKFLKAHGLEVIVVGELPGGDLLKAVTEGMTKANLFIIMGTATYGKQTSGMIDTCQEMQHIKSSRKSFFLINMNPEESLMEFQEAATNLIFNLYTTAWVRWKVGDPMPPTLLPKIIEKLSIVQHEGAIDTADADTAADGIEVDTHGMLHKTLLQAKDQKSRLT
jgi:hypothetical protein